MAQIEIANSDLLRLDGLTTDAALQHLIDSIKTDKMLTEKIGDDAEAECIKAIIKL